MRSRVRALADMYGSAFVGTIRGVEVSNALDEAVGRAGREPNGSRRLDAEILRRSKGPADCRT